MSVATAPEAEESSKRNLKSTVLWGLWGVRTCLRVHGQKRSPRRSNMQAARLWGLFLPRSCSSKGERTEGLRIQKVKGSSFDVS